MPKPTGNLSIFTLAGALAALSVCGRAAPADDVQRWIRQLGADGFRERQAAHQTLLERGPEVLPQLREAAGVGDLETRQRATRLVNRLREAQYGVLLRELLSLPLRPAPDGLPAWNRYRVICGDTAESRTLYAEMLRCAPDLLQLLEAEDPELPLALHPLIDDVAAASRRETAQASAVGISSSDYPEAQVALLLFLAVEYEAVNQSLIAAQLPAWVGGVDGLEVAGGVSAGFPLHQLLSAWALSPHTASRTQRMALARQMGLPAALGPAREALADSQPSLGEQQEAILLIARFGGVEHVPDLEPLLADGTEINVYHRRRELKFQTRLQDLALVALLRLTGQDPAEYHFASPLAENAQTVYSPQSVGFATEEDRQAALRKWRRWRAIQLRSPRFPPLDAVEGVTL
jgi:hypothetical protein